MSSCRMNRVKTDKQCQQGAPVPCIQMPVSQQASYNQSSGTVQYMHDGTQALPSLAMTNTQTAQTSAGPYQYCVGPSQYLHEGTQAMSMASAQTSQPSQGSVWVVQHNMLQQTAQPLSSNGMYMGKPTVSGSTGDFSACQMHKPSSSLMQGVVGANGHSSLKPMEDSYSKKELRLMKNREAARKCRRKKKEYVKNLESRVALLENEQSALAEELKAIKNLSHRKV